jgi:ferredoxin hydrogenase small subunit
MNPTRNILWLQSAGCGGCTMSLLSAESPDWFTLLQTLGFNLLWHPTLSEQSGEQVVRILEDCASGKVPVDFLCLEGALLKGPKGTGRFHVFAGRPMTEWVERMAGQARHVLAVGSCAAYGGMVRSELNPTEVAGMQFDGDVQGGFLGADFRSRSGLPVINVSGCAPHPNWLTETLIGLAVNQFGAEDLDRLGRPRFFADHLVHHGCRRNEYYEFKASAEKPSDLGCLMENLGCMGTQAHADCNTRLWNGVGSCTRGGYACINCTAPGFEDPGHGFLETPKVAGIPIGLPTDMPKAWFVALAALSKSATPRRVKENAVSDHQVVVPVIRKTGSK